MQPPRTPANEALRLQALKATELLDSGREEVFDSLTETARLAFDVPICALTLVDEHRQWFKSSHGLDVCETGRDISFCGHAIYHDDTLLVQDALTDKRFADNPLVTGEPHIRFYAGAPIRIDVFSETVDLGTVCIIDRRSRPFGASQAALLESFARHAESLIQMHLVSRHLELTCKQLQNAIRKLENSR
ncbi:MAG TPA: GAF domain-containing protein [Marinobacter sp.]|uniref:GAF domain-containing protein n=1 Tax=Marinobacter sp. TaxID=50741 RepID=UPI002D7E8CC5|nr:GAF domain-containing protein [Marinobacter sp.]HET8801093.1 GAF domain-containing protein [Marinobacter sp.]